MPIPQLSSPSPRQLLREDAFTRIRSAIVDGTLEPGERLADGDLAAWLGISRTPVRQALARLEDAGLVQTKPGRYTIVSPVDVRSVRNAQAVTSAMHELAVREAVPLMGEEHIARMRAANHDFAGALAAADLEGAVAADDAFHRVAVDLCANHALSAVLEQFTPLLRRAERIRFAALVGRSSVEQHRLIADLAALGDAEGAARETRLNWLTLQPELTPAHPPA